MSSPQMFTFSWSELTSSLASTAQQLHLDGELIDVTLSAGGKIFRAHKLVLSAASPLLMEMLKSTTCTNPVVLLAGITAEDLEAILQFIYHGEVTIDPIRLPCLLQAAQCLDIRALSPPPSFDKIVPSSVYPSASHVVPGGKISAASPYGTVKKQRRNKVEVLSNNEEEYNNIPNDLYRSDIGMGESLNEGEIAMRRASISSDLPVSCHICGALIRQSRNLRRHMELVHMRTDCSQRTTKKKKGVGTTSPSLGSSSPSVGRPDVHEEGPASDLDHYAPSAHHGADSYLETDNRSHQDSRSSSQDSRLPPNVTHTTDPSQAENQVSAPPADQAGNTSTSSAPPAEPTPQPPGSVSGTVNPSHFLPLAPSPQRLHVYHDTKDDHS